MPSRRPNPTGAAIYFDRQAKSLTECARVLAAIDNAAGLGATIREISVATGLPDHVVSARVGDLRGDPRKGTPQIIEEAPLRRPCRVNGIMKKVWTRAPASAQLALFRRSA